MKAGNTFKCSSYLGYEVMEIGRAIADAKEIFYRLYRHKKDLQESCFVAQKR